VTVTEPELGAFIAVFVRAAALAATAPVIGDAGVPVRAKLVFVVAIAFAVGANRAGVSYADLPATAGLELGLGLVTGLTARFVMARVAVAGQLMGVSLGLGFAQQYDPHAGESAGTVRTLMTTLSGIAFLSTGGLEAVVRSVATGPAHIGDIATMGTELLRQGTDAFAHGLMLAAPIVLAALVGNVGLAVMNRAAPAVNVFSIAFGCVLILGGAVLVATATSLVGGMAEISRQAIAVMVG
jgi:flagellar biosynthetic protein FliR